MGSVTRLLAALTAALELSSCLSVVRGSTERINLASDPPGAEVSLNDGQKGVTPFSVRVNRKQNLVAHFSKDGYASVDITDDSMAQPLGPFEPAFPELPAGASGEEFLVFMAGMIFVVLPLELAVYAAETTIDAKTGALNKHQIDMVFARLESSSSISAPAQP